MTLEDGAAPGRRDPMSFECDDCGKALGSDGGLEVHQMQCQGRSARVAVAAAAPVAGTWASPPSPVARGTTGVNRGAVAIAMIAALLGIGALAFVVIVPKESSSAGIVPVASAPAPPAAVPAGYRTLDRPEDRFSIAVPSSYQELTLAGADLEAAADNLESVNPAMADFLRKNKSLVAQARLFSFDPQTGDSQLVQRIVVPGADAITDVPNGTFSAEYKNLGVEGVTEERVKLASGDAFKVTAMITSASGRALVTQHVLVGNSVAWILTYTDGGGEPSEIGSTIAATFRSS